MPVTKYIRKFMQLEASAGIALLTMAVLALIVDNSPARGFYHRFFETMFTVSIGEYVLSKSILLWINDGFMVIFFLLVGLEIKREILVGELKGVAKAALPLIAAFGGMLVPALVYVGFNWGNPSALNGWAIPTATDIAFSLGILALLGSRIPTALKVFLMALAIFDDVGSICIIGFFYSHDVSYTSLLLASGIIVILILMNRFGVTNRFAYFLFGIILWICVLQSGVHATIAGIILALVIPLSDKKRPYFSPARALEHDLHPWVSFGILPLFAFANAGISFSDLSFAHLVGPITLGITFGLFIGKQLGIWGATMLAIKSNIAKMPNHCNGLSIYGVSLVGGVGFTMSLFIGTLAFGYGPGSELSGAYVRTGVLLGSLLSGVCGYFLLRWSSTRSLTNRDASTPLETTSHDHSRD